MTICNECGLKLSKIQIKRGNNYCSRKCYHNSTIGKESPNRGKKGIFKANSGSFKKGHIPINKGISKKEYIKCLYCGDSFLRKSKTQQFCSKSCGLKNRKKGQILKSPRNRLIRGSNEYKEWRLMVFGRDDFTCQDCGKRGCYLEAHHIKGFAKYPKLRFNVKNGITYCRKCHIKNDNNIGRKIKNVSN